MADPYSGVSISNYNSNPPADDGSQVEANRVKWSTIKTKLNDPIKTRTDSMDAALITAFAKVMGGGGVTSTAISYQVLSADQGKLVRASASGVTITTPDATDVDSPFVFGLLNDSTGDITFDGSGSQTIDGDASVTVPAGCGVLVFTDGSNWFTDGQNFQRTQVMPQGYLTLIPIATDALSPIPASDQSAKTAVYYRPYVGNLVPIPNGTLFAVREFSELTLTLNANHVANGIYDVFVFAHPDTGAITIGTGPVWTTVTAGSGARGTGAGTTELEILKGLPVNKVAATMRNGATTYSVGAKSAIYLGSIYMDGSNGQITCHVSHGQNRKWGVWNAWNRRKITLQAGDSTSSWTYGSSTTRQSNGAAGNKATVFCGLAEEIVAVEFKQQVQPAISASGQTTTTRIGVGWNVTNGHSGRVGQSSLGLTVGGGATINGSTIAESNASYVAQPFIGIGNANCVEDTPAAGGTATFYGTASLMVLEATWLG